MSARSSAPPPPPDPGPEPTEEDLARAIEAAWPRAQAHWASFLLLSPPVQNPDQHSVAQIDLATRVVSLNGPQIRARRLLGALEGILAHEIGHHVRYPATLALHARLRLLERTLIPIDGYSVVNLFTDLLINEHLGPALSDQLAAVYRAFVADGSWEQDPAFVFYLSVYEELWRRPPGDLMGPHLAPFEAHYPAYRADAQLLAQDLFAAGPNVFTQFIYFASVLARYIEPRGGRALASLDPNQCGCGEPSPDDWADALTPGAREREAIERALREGWITREQADRMDGPEARERRMLGLPGAETDEQERVPEIMAAFYRQQAERYLLRPPPRRTLGEAVVPTTLEDWEPGDAVRAVDWLATLGGRGPDLGAVAPLKREQIADYEGLEVPDWQPRVEIYLDVSGSMPDPTCSVNAMTLAAQVLAVGAIRAGGAARALLYSGDHVRFWEWCRSEVEMSRFLMHYIGGGTEFPFQVLAESVRSCEGRQPVRVVISDLDFDQNYASRPGHAAVVAQAAAEPAGLVLLLHRPNPEAAARYRAAGARVVAVDDLEDFPKVAGQLSLALFDPGASHVGV